MSDLWVRVYLTWRTTPFVVKGCDDYAAHCHVRGNVIALPGYCERGCRFVVYIGQHKGNTHVWAEDVILHRNAENQKIWSGKPPPPQFDSAKLKKIAAKLGGGVDAAWLAARSPIRPDNWTRVSFLQALYPPGEAIVIRSGGSRMKSGF